VETFSSARSRTTIRRTIRARHLDTTDIPTISLVLDQNATPCLDAGHGVQAERPEMSDMRFYLEELFRFGMELII
jgi:ribosomal protein S12 methylthiotransferase accessory factor YcaO